MTRLLVTVNLGLCIGVAFRHVHTGRDFSDYPTNQAVGLSVTGECEDEGQNHYYDLRKEERRLRVEKTET